jgi:nitrite reductase/ring-hydroxylating ferredoxin subunit
MRSTAEILDLERVVCRLADLEAHGCRGFTIGRGEWPLRGFVVRTADGVRGFINRCPHAGHPLDLRPQHFLTADGALILCSSHGALFEKSTGYCVSGPCAGRTLTPVPLEVQCGFVLLTGGVDIDALAEMAP